MRLFWSRGWGEEGGRIDPQITQITQILGKGNMGKRFGLWAKSGLGELFGGLEGLV